MDEGWMDGWMKGSTREWIMIMIVVGWRDTWMDEQMKRKKEG